MEFAMKLRSRNPRCYRPRPCFRQTNPRKNGRGRKKAKQVCPCMDIEGNSYSTEFVNVWCELRQNKQLCDGVVRTADGGEFHIHRAILSAISPYFKALFTNSLKRGVPEVNEVTVDMITSDALSIILDYAYSGKCNVTSENVEKLLPIADQFEVLGVLKQCCEFLLNELRPDNCLGIFRYAKHYFCTNLHTKGRKYILHTFSEVLRSPEFVDLSYDDLEDLLRDDELNVRNEELVFEAVKKWVEHDPEERPIHLPTLLSCVRFGLMRYKYFTDAVMQWRYIVESQYCQSVLSEAALFLLETEARDELEVDLRDPLARPRIPYEVLFAIGGWSAGSPTSFLETYDIRANRWYLSLNNDAKPRAYHGLAVLHGLIYVIGGFDGNEHFNSVRCYDPVNTVWTERACMYHARCYISVCTTGSKIYALGGYNGRTRLAKAERYDPATNQWEIISSMNRQRSDASATTLSGKVYIAGGFNGQEVLSSCEIFDPIINQWTYIHPMTSARSGVNLLSYKGCIYALGGFNGFSRLKTGEKYDPSQRGNWVPVTDMLNPRSNFATAVLDEMIFAIGGFNGTTTIASVEFFDGNANCWHGAASMNLNRSALSGCVVAGLPNTWEYSYLSKEHGGGGPVK